MDNNSNRSLPIKSYRQIRLNTKLLIGFFFFSFDCREYYIKFIEQLIYIYIYVHFYLDGSHKSQQHHHHHQPPPPQLAHYPPFYRDIIVQPTNEPVDLAVAAELDKERQNIEKCLSNLSSPMVKIY